MRVRLSLPGPNEHDEGHFWSIGKCWEICGRRGMAEHAQELAAYRSEEGAGTTRQALTHATRHVRQETRVLPLDPAYCLAVFRIRDCSSFCFPLHGYPD